MEREGKAGERGGESDVEVERERRMRDAVRGIAVKRGRAMSRSRAPRLNARSSRGAVPGSVAPRLVFATLRRGGSVARVDSAGESGAAGRCVGDRGRKGRPAGKHGKPGLQANTASQGTLLAIVRGAGSPTGSGAPWAAFRGRIWWSQPGQCGSTATHGAAPPPARSCV